MSLLHQRAISDLDNLYTWFRAKYENFVRKQLVGSAQIKTHCCTLDHICVLLIRICEAWTKAVVYKLSLLKGHLKDLEGKLDSKYLHAFCSTTSCGRCCGLDCF